jgi:hypothetical protein
MHLDLLKYKYLAQKMSARDVLKSIALTLMILSCLTLGFSLSGERCFAYGLFFTPDGVPASGHQARALVASTPTGLRLIIQGDYKGDLDSKAFWLIAVPNINNLDDHPPIIRSLGSDALDELVELTAPRFEGACEEVPNEQLSESTLQLTSGLVEGRALSFNAVKLSPSENEPEGVSEFERFLDARGVTLTDDLLETFRWGLDQNFMFILVEYEAGAMSEGVSPTLDISLPLGENIAARVALKPLALSVMGTPSDLVFWTLGQTRQRVNFPTQEVDTSLVQFTSPETTDYLQQFDVLSQTQQTQLFVTEYAGVVDPATFFDQTLATLRNEILGTQLTRLRARMISAALRSNAASITFRDSNDGAYPRAHRVVGHECPEGGGAEGGAEGGTPEGGGEGGDADGGSDPSAGAIGGGEAGLDAGAQAGAPESAGVMDSAGMTAGSTAGREGTSASPDDGGCAQASGSLETARSLSLLILLSLIALFTHSRRLKSMMRRSL